MVRGRALLAVGEVPAVRMTVARRWSRHYEGATLPEDQSIRMWSFQPSLDLRIPNTPATVGGGVAIHNVDVPRLPRLGTRRVLRR